MIEMTSFDAEFPPAPPPLVLKHLTDLVLVQLSLDESSSSFSVDSCGRSDRDELSSVSEMRRFLLPPLDLAYCD